MSPNFESLREQLLRAGVTPRRVQRYVVELREHLADLTARERAAGLDARQAAGRATALLGGEAELVRALLERTPARALATRAPWAVFAMLPVLVFVAVIFAIATTMMHLMWPMQGRTFAQLPENYRTLIELTGVVANYLLGALLAAACIVVALRQRLTSAWMWVGLSLIAVLSGAFGIHMHVFAADGPYMHKGGMVFSALGIVYSNEHPDFTATFGVALLRAAVLFAVAALAYRVGRLRLQPSA